MPYREPRVLPWEQLASLLTDLLFPPRCIACGQVDTWLCEPCAERIPRLEGPVCPRCGMPGAKAAPCPRCQQSPPRLEGIRSVFLFDGLVRDAIHRLKYRHGRQLARPLGQAMADFWTRHPCPVDVIVPVPLHFSRFLQRGYNQSALLGYEMGRRLGLPLDESLQRTRATASQMRLKAADRRQNVQGAFACADGRLAGRRVLLIDDVCTTGATLEACADAARAGGATAVWALTLARAP